MHFVILVTLIVIASGRDISEARYGRRDTLQISPPPSEINHEQFEQNRYGHFNNQNRQANYRQDSNSHGYNTDIINNDRRHSFANVNQGRSHVFTGNINVNQAVDRQIHDNRHDHGNLNHPTQNFNSNEYSNVDHTSNDDRAHKYHQNVMQPHRQEDSMVIADNGNYNGRKTFAEPNNSNLSRDNVPNQDVVNVLNKVNNYSNQNKDNNNHRRNNNNSYNQSGLTANSNMFYNADESPIKTTTENEDTNKTFRNDATERENRTVDEDRWVWSVESTTERGDLTTLDPTTPTLDDRAAFSGDQCASGMARILGKCVPVD